MIWFAQSETSSDTRNEGFCGGGQRERVVEELLTKDGIYVGDES